VVDTPLVFLTSAGHFPLRANSVLETEALYGIVDRIKNILGANTAVVMIQAPCLLGIVHDTPDACTILNYIRVSRSVAGTGACEAFAFDALVQEDGGAIKQNRSINVPLIMSASF